MGAKASDAEEEEGAEEEEQIAMRRKLVDLGRLGRLIARKVLEEEHCRTEVVEGTPCNEGVAVVEADRTKEAEANVEGAQRDQGRRATKVLPNLEDHRLLA